MKKTDWGAGPWAVPREAKGLEDKRIRGPVVGGRAELEDILNQKVRSHYGLMRRLRLPSGLSRARAALIGLLVLLWLVALFVKP